MHFIFIPYGERREVEILLRDMEAQKHFMPYKEGGGCWINGGIRVLPFGVYEYVCPKESADAVMHTLNFEQTTYKIPKIAFTFLRKFINCEKLPIYKKGVYYRWIKENVNIIPIGVRYDGDILDPLINKTHEAL